MRLLIQITAIIFLTGFLCSTSYAQLKLTATDDGLKGPVRTVQTTLSNFHFDARLNKYAEDVTTPKSAAYDRQGRKTETYLNFLRDDQSKQSKEIYAYDATGQLQEIDDYDSAGKIENKSVATYDAKGRVISIVGSWKSKAGLFSGDGPPMEIALRIAYSSNGKTEEVTMGDADKQLPFLFRTLSVFGPTGNLLSETFFAAERLESQTTHIYDSQGRLVKTRETKPRERATAEELYPTMLAAI